MTYTIVRTATGQAGYVVYAILPTYIYHFDVAKWRTLNRKSHRGDIDRNGKGKQSNQRVPEEHDWIPGALWFLMHPLLGSTMGWDKDNRLGYLG